MTQGTNNLFILVDGSSYLYRAYYAFPPLTNSAGELTGVIYGVLNMLRSLIMQYKPSHFAIIFDSEGKTFRNELFEQYKSQRPLMPNNLRKQIAPLYEIIIAMGFPLLTISGVEADDVIGTLAIQASQKGLPVLISTSDKDMAQLVSADITLINTMTNSIFGPAEVIEKYGVPPKLIIDFLALMGDSSDSIPGIPGVGKKTALTLLQHFGNLSAIYQNLSVIASLGFRGSKTLAKKMVQYKDIAFLSYKLATIKTNVNLTIDYNKLVMQSPDIKKLYMLFNRYEFKHWLADIQKIVSLKEKMTHFPIINSVSNNTHLFQNSINRSSTEHHQIILTKTDLMEWIKKIESVKYFAFKTETDSLDVLSANLIGLSFAIEDGSNVYLPLRRDSFNASQELSIDQVLIAIKPIFVNNNIQKIGYNLKFNYEIMANYDIELKNIAFDILLESYVLHNVNINKMFKRHNVNSFKKEHFDYESTKFEEIADKRQNWLTFNQIPLQEVLNYATKNIDVTFTLLLHQILWSQLETEPKLKNIFQDIEMPLVPVLARMELIGVLVDKNKLTKQSQEIENKLIKIKKEAYVIAKQEFNLASPKQVQVILFEKFQLPIIKKTSNGTPSTNEEVLEELAFIHKLPKIILQYRNLSKLKSTYIDKLLTMINPKTKRVHTSYQQAVTTTGRLSSRDPNLQNIPIKTKEGRRIRQAFIARKGYKIMTADYSQIELRIISHFSQDEGLLNAFDKGQDIHRTTAAEIFDVSLTDVTSEQRRSAKAINFGLIYGITVFGLSRQLGIAYEEAQYYMDRYFERYPKILDYMEYTRNQVIKNGYVETLAGRRLYLPDINSHNLIERKAAEREAINAPIQGTAADIIKKAMISLDKWIETVKPNIYMLIQVHDELVFEVKESAINWSEKKIRQLMEQNVQLNVPLKVNIGIGNNWDEAH